MSKLNNLKGNKYGRLTVLSKANYNKYTWWNCVCDCGNKTVVRGDRLLNGTTLSCGCLRKEVAKETQLLNFKTHGKYKTRLHRIWTNMIQRCYNEKSKSFKYYGGKGIIVCEEWLNSFQTFYDWAMANGYEEHLTIDREDNDGNYEPSNCRWITLAEQQKNRSNNVGKRVFK